MSAAFKVTNVTHTSRPHETDQTLTRHTVSLHMVPLGVELPMPNFSVVRSELFDRLNGLPGVPDDPIYSQIHKGCTLLCTTHAEDPYTINRIVSVIPASKLVPFKVVSVERETQEQPSLGVVFHHIRVRMNRCDVKPIPGQVHKHIGFADIRDDGKPGFTDNPIFNEIHVGCTLMLEPDFETMDQPYVNMAVQPASKL